MSKRIDLVGHKYGRLTVMEELAQYKTKRRFLCECECGKLTVALMDSLRSGNTQSCGCLRDETSSETKTVEITGQTFGRLTVLSRIGRNIHYQATWLCRCSCGKTVTVSGSDLRNGGTRSCGCLRKKYIDRRDYYRKYYHAVRKYKLKKSREQDKKQEE